jgi:hypothetical protein
MSACVLLDSALVNLKSASQLVDGNAVGVSLDQLLHLGRFKSPAHLVELGTTGWELVALSELADDLVGRVSPTFGHCERGAGLIG